ncbi:MAG: M42 family metallopeptidase [Bacillota bacterium]
MDDNLKLYQELTEAPGAPGQEDEVRAIMRRYLEPFGRIVQDNLGSIYAEKIGQAGGVGSAPDHAPRIAVAGHMDEIALMVTRITDEGFIKFTGLGGWFDYVMPAQRMTVHTRKGVITGVVGNKPPHTMSEQERKKPADKKNMYLDIGAASRQEAEEGGVRPGDPILPICPFTTMLNPKLMMAKAWDNRAGCAAAVLVLRELARGSHPNVVYAGGTVQEEVGTRGAQTSAALVQPDIAFVLDVGMAGDIPGAEGGEVTASLGKGPIITLYDPSHVPHRALREFVCEVADAEGIPYQFDVLAHGGTDAARFHLWNKGAPSLYIGFPARYVHSAASVVHRDDLENAARLVAAVIRRLDADALKRIRGF